MGTVPSTPLRARVLMWLLSVAVCAAGGATLAFDVRSAAQPAGGAEHDTIAVIVSVENTLDHLSVGDLRRILLGEMTRWPNGRTITIAMRPAGQAERDALLHLVCGMTNADFDRHSLHTAYRGETQSAVKILDTSVGVRRFVVNVPGAIGFVRSDEVDGSIKVMPLTGTVPGDASFGLKLWSR